MAERRLVVTADVGLHARPAALFVQAAARAPMDVTVEKAGVEQAGEPVNAKSILAVLGLDVRNGDEIVLRAEGDGSDEVLDAMARVAARGQPGA